MSLIQQVKYHIEITHLAWLSNYCKVQVPDNGTFPELTIIPDLIPTEHNSTTIFEMKSRSTAPNRPESRDYWWALMSSQVRGYLAAQNLGYNGTYIFVLAHIRDLPSLIHQTDPPFREAHIKSREIFVVPLDIWQIAYRPDLTTKNYVNIGKPKLINYLEDQGYEMRSVDNGTIMIANNLEDDVKECFM